MGPLFSFLSSYWWLVFPFAAIVGGWGKAVAAYSERRRRDKIELARIEAEAAQRAVATSAPPRVRQLAKTMATHDKVNDRWFSYEMDLATLIDFPMLIDLREPLTEAFHRARVRADTLRPAEPDDFDDPATADEATIEKAAWDTVPNVALSFYSFRLMMGLGFLFIAMFATAFYFISLKRNVPRWFLRLAFFAIPLPWIAAELGWILAEAGRQPWVIDGVLPTFMGVSSLTVQQVIMTMVGFTLLYGTLAIIEISLMVRAVKLGPGARILPKGGGGGDALNERVPAAPRTIQFDQ